MSERDIKRWQDTITPRDKAPHPWTIGSGGSWDMMEVQPIPDAMLAELAQRYQYAGTPWNCRSTPLSESDREYMYMLYYGMQGLVARLRLAEKERDFAKTEIARLHDDIRELTDVRVLDEEDRDLLAWLQGTSTKPEPSMPPPDIYVSDAGTPCVGGIEMIDINELRQSLGAVQPEEVAELLDRLAVAEKDIALKERVIDSLGLALNAAAHERDNLRAKIEAMEKQGPVGQFIQHPSNGLWEQDGYGDNPDARPLYALPGAKGEEK